MNITKALEFASLQLREATIAEPEREASLLLRFVLKRDPVFVYSHPEYQLDAVESILFKAVVKRRAAREPFQYISGRQEFFGLDFRVTPDVLIPRPETELLVETAIGRFKNIGNFRFLELGVGSGCITIAILKNLPNATAFGVDISEAALGVTKQNAEKLQVVNRLKLVRSNLFENVTSENFDLIVSNPPYIPEGDVSTLQPEVRDYEPLTALVGGDTGLEIVRSIIQESHRFLKPSGVLLLEIGFGQSEMVSTFFDKPGWQSLEFLKDLQGIDRTVLAVKK